ncbi:MAG: hypothetical protein ACTSSG_07705 [Candidatus Heimdallarchaeaceae archaeon]
MNSTLDDIIQKMNQLVDKEVLKDEGFGLEFGTFTIEKLKATSIKSIVVSSQMSLKLVHFMNETNSNLAITILPLPVLESSFPLSEKNFELLKALVSNNLRTFRLTEGWLFSSRGSFIYFLHTLGISKLDYSCLDFGPNLTLNTWTVPHLSFDDFLTSLSHHSKNWVAYSYNRNSAPLRFIMEKQNFTTKDLKTLKKEGINVVVSYVNDSKRMRFFQEAKVNFLFIPFTEYCNIALRKFSQILQLELNEKVLFYPHEVSGWKTATK